MASSDKRSQKLKRLVTVQRHMEKMAEIELSDTTRHRGEILRSMDNVLEALGSAEPLHQMFSRHYSERYGRLMVKDKQLAAVQEFQETKVLTEKTKADRLRDKMYEAREDEQREADDNAIYELIEITLATQTPASSKVGGS